jgi:UrcA family protein
MNASRVLASLIGASALAIVLLAPPVTHADSFDQRATVAVRFGDLNLDTLSGAQALLRRIRIAAGEVCRQYEPHGSLIPSVAHQACIRDAVSGAVHSVDLPLLSAYYNAQADRHLQNTASR